MLQQESDQDFRYVCTPISVADWQPIENQPLVKCCAECHFPGMQSRDLLHLEIELIFFRIENIIICDVIICLQIYIITIEFYYLHLWSMLDTSIVLFTADVLYTLLHLDGLVSSV